MTGLDNVTYIGGSLEIADNDALSTLNGLENLDLISSSLYIDGNPTLTSLTGLENLTSNTISSISISNNLSLNSCEVQWLCDYLSSPTGNVNIYNNANGCHDPSEIANGCGIVLPCLPFGNYYFTSQADIDNFQIHYPGCISLEGNVIINGIDIINLEGLNSINSIGGDLHINDSDSLTTLEGLENLIYIGGNLKIYYNHELTNLSGLGNLTYIGGNIEFKYNPALSGCAIESICDYLNSPNGNVIIQNNAIGCDSPFEVEEACLCWPNGIEFTSQSQIDNFPNCYEVLGDVYIGSINGTDITNVNGLSILTHISGDLRIFLNEYLTNLTGLSNLSSLSGSLRIEGNNNLSSLTGLENIESGSIETLIIRYNNFLSNCEVTSICNYLVSPTGNTLIMSNALGCNSIQQVQDSCNIASVENGKINSDLTISPNPTNDQAILSLNLSTSASVNIWLCNTAGICLKSWQFSNEQPGNKELILDLKETQAGIYFCRIQIGNEMITKKIIKL